MGSDDSSVLVIGLCRIDIKLHALCFNAKAGTSVFLYGGLCVNTHPPCQFSLTLEEKMCTTEAFRLLL